MRAVPTAPPSTITAPSLYARFAAMTYESVLLFAVLFIAGYPLLALLRWQHPLSEGQRAVLFGFWVLVLGVYFVWQWRHGGRTLPLKTWDLRVTDPAGGAPSLARLILRYAAGWTLFAPAALYIALARPDGGLTLLALAASPYLMQLPALVDPQRQLLHDRLAGTRLIRELAPAGRPAR
jgi:uncharacterized RDD family membrane protein YckC